jgi:hypothetical protein
MNKTDSKSAKGIDRPDSLLDDQNGLAVVAWQAYNAMETTKRRHFECLEILDEKKKNYNIDPTEDDRQLLSCLLKDHDEQVKRFTEASQQLKLVDASAHAALFNYIGTVNAVQGRSAVRH